MHYRIVSAAIATAALAACAPGDQKPAEAPASPPNVVTYTALDFRFEGPAEIPAGPTTFQLKTAGKELHHMTLVKLEEGKTFDSLQAAMKNPGPPPSWMVFVGGPNAPAPGAESNATINLEPGNYAMLCFVDTPDKIMHMMKGMAAPLTVTAPATPSTAAMAVPTTTVTLAEYSFALDKPLTAGKHLVRVLNSGKEPHEFEIIRMEPGKKLADLGAWLANMQGPPPGMPLGGVSPVGGGKEGQFEIDLAPGSYVLACFLPAADGKLHLEHGMVQEFEIH